MLIHETNLNFFMVFHGMLKKKFRAVDGVLQNSQLTHITIDLRIARAILNRFFKRIYSDIGDAENIAKKMYLNKDKTNNLSNIIIRYGLNRKTQFVDIVSDDEINDFPQLSLQILKNDIRFGSFQLKLGPSYLTDFLIKI